ncbi:DHS-like NAD/FAD-binding domain-containing protein [Tuber brumale]|nr:DHS-like NAD/FAD-binding domain-containing protein [Tuber brumale]
MGAELSTQVDSDTPPETISRRDIPALVEFVLGGKCERIVFLCGARISTSAGILDFRTPGTDLHSNLQTPNPSPGGRLRHKPFLHQSLTFSHPCEIPEPRPIHPEHTLERVAGVPLEGLVEAHGSFAGQSCIDCHAEHLANRMKKHLLTRNVPQYETCTGLVKPNIGMRRLAEELGWTEELEEVWRSVGGGSDKKVEAEAESSEDAEPVESMDAKVSRLTDEVERSLSVVDDWTQKA